MSLEELVKKLLLIIDTFALALKNVEEENDFVSGIKLIHEQFLMILKQEGVEEIKAKGEIFDPDLHEAVLTESHKDLKNMLIIEELQKGFSMHGKVIRATKVKVNKIN